MLSDGALWRGELKVRGMAWGTDWQVWGLRLEALTEQRAVHSLGNRGQGWGWGCGSDAFGFICLFLPVG